MIALAPYDVMRMAQAAGLSTGQTIAHFTLRRGSLLRFNRDGSCVALSSGLCSIHRGRPLPCRLYPLGLEWTPEGERFVTLEPAAGSKGVYAEHGTVGSFLDRQGVQPYLDAVQCYRTLLPLMRDRIQALADFEKTEPAEFRRVAVREALAESGYDYNPIIEMMFDSDPWSGFEADGVRSTSRHIARLRQAIQDNRDALEVAAAAVLLAVSLGCTPQEAFARRLR